MTKSLVPRYDRSLLEEVVSKIPDGTPWYQGESVFRDLQNWEQPEGPFFHFLLDGRATLLEVGDVMTSPAARRELPWMVRQLPEEYRTPHYLALHSFDVHAVYFQSTNHPEEHWHIGTYYQVEPIGLMWPDPECPGSDAWCASSARIIVVQ